jgi:class I fructose-bisphosphate aldolase
MRLTQNVRRILTDYSSENLGTQTNLARILMHGKLAGTGKLIVYAIDQGFEHGPARAFQVNPASYDPHYHFQFGLDAGVSAIAVPLGMLECAGPSFVGAIPTILKINSSNSLYRDKTAADQSCNATVADAVRLGCSAVGFTLYPGSDQNLEILEECREVIAEAKAYGLAAVIWSYARGGDVSKEGELALDVIAYGAHLACQLGAHVVKVKPPTAHIELEAAKKAYASVKKDTLAERVAHVKESCFGGRRLLVVSGMEATSEEAVLNNMRQVAAGGGNGTAIGRNLFQRPRAEGLAVAGQLADIFKGKR